MLTKYVSHVTTGGHFQCDTWANSTNSIKSESMDFLIILVFFFFGETAVFKVKNEINRSLTQNLFSIKYSPTVGFLFKVAAFSQLEWIQILMFSQREWKYPNIFRNCSNHYCHIIHLSAVHLYANSHTFTQIWLNDRFSL